MCMKQEMQRGEAEVALYECSIAKRQAIVGASWVLHGDFVLKRIKLKKNANYFCDIAFAGSMWLSAG